MSVPSPEELVEARRWLKEAGEELAVATVIGGNPELPGRVACFHAHLAGEKALKALQIRRGVVIRKVHNLVQLAAELPAGDQPRFEGRDLDLLNPWTIDARYPADLEDVSQETIRQVLAAAGRVLSPVRESVS
ncbi:MAG: HEPN domain-containing protein [Acidimicrobiales bacterium]